MAVERAGPWAAHCCGPIGTKTWDQIMHCAPSRTLQDDPKLRIHRTVWKQYFTPIACDDGKIDIETLDAHLAYSGRCVRNSSLGPSW